MPTDLIESSCPRCGKNVQIAAASTDNGRKCPACGAALGEPEANLQTAVASGSPAPIPTAAKGPMTEPPAPTARLDASSRFWFLGVAGCAACVGVGMLVVFSLVACMLFIWKAKAPEIN